MKNPLRQSVSYYAQLMPCEPVHLEALCQDVSDQCTVTVHDVKAVISALQEHIFKILRDGNSVRLGDLGSFHPTLATTGSDLAKDVTAANVTGVRVRFTASPRMRFELSPKNPAVIFKKCADPTTSGPEPPSSGLEGDSSGGL